MWTLHPKHKMTNSGFLFHRTPFDREYPHPLNYPPRPTDYRHTDQHLRNGLAMRGRTYKRTDGRYQVHYLPASRSIMISFRECLEPQVWSNPDQNQGHNSLNPGGSDFRWWTVAELKLYLICL